MSSARGYRVDSHESGAFASLRQPEMCSTVRQQRCITAAPRLPCSARAACALSANTSSAVLVEEELCASVQEPLVHTSAVANNSKNNRRFLRGTSLKRVGTTSAELQIPGCVVQECELSVTKEHTITALHSSTISIMELILLQT